MERLILRQRNNHRVGAIPLPIDKRQIRGAEISAEPYSNMFLCGKKKSGKSSVIFYLLKNFVGKKTKVIIFCSTFFKDKSYIEIRNWMKKNNVEYEAYEDLYEDGVNKLQEIINELDEEAKAREKAKEEEKEEEIDHHEVIKKLLGRTPHDEQKEKENKKEKKEKLLSPEYIFVFDDLSHQLKDPSINRTICKNRHYLCKTIISSQYWNHLDKATRKQIDIFILFRSLPPEKIKEIVLDSDISIPWERLYQIYRQATKEPFSFLYLATANDELRQNFNKEIVLQGDENTDTTEN